MLYLEPPPDDPGRRRRRLLQASTAVLVGGTTAAFLAGKGWSPVVPGAARVATGRSQPSPAPAAPVRRDWILGSAFNDGYAADLRQSMVQQFNTFVPEYALKMGALITADGRYDFALAERELRFAETNHKALMGHTLIWHRHLPANVNPQSDVTSLRQRFETHIPAVMTRWHPRIRLWDVVNEAIHVEDGRPDGMRRSPWLKAFGAGYVGHAFKLARASNPDPLLMYNDFGFWYDTPAQARKRKALLRMLERELAQGAKIDVLGIQGHLDASESRFSEKVFDSFLGRVEQLGLATLVTELDVRDDRVQGPYAVRDEAVAVHARRFLDVTLARGNCLGVIFWGLSDRHSWLQEAFPRADKLALRPLPFDAQTQAKPLWHSMLRAMDSAPARSARTVKLIEQCLAA